MQREKDGIQLTVKKLENASKSLNKLIDSQIVDNCKKGLGYNVVLPPHTGLFMPPKPDLSYIGLEEFTSEPAVETLNAKTSKDVPKAVKKDNGSPIIEDWKSNDEDESVPQPKIEKKTVKPSVAKAEFVKPKQSSQNARPKAVVNTARTKALLNAVKGNIFYLTYYEEINGGYVAFGGNSKGGNITGKGTIKNGKPDFKNVNFVKELKFNLFSVSQMYDKKNSVLFNDTEFVVLSPDFKLTNENHVLLRVHRKNNMYSVDLKNIIPKGGKFDGKVDEGFFVGYSLNSKAFRVFNSRTRIVEKTLHISQLLQVYNLMVMQTVDPPFLQEPKSYQDARFKPSNDIGKKCNEVSRQENECKYQEEKDSVNNTNKANVVHSIVNAASNEVNVVGRKSSIKLPNDPYMP
nr:putative ribonuclease H-like domain-containing protein [Tanacetum cinerariifolium]